MGDEGGGGGGSRDGRCSWERAQKLGMFLLSIEGMFALGYMIETGKRGLLYILLLRHIDAINPNP